MNTSLFASVDCQRPWLMPFLADAGSLIRAEDWQTELNTLVRDRGLRNHRGAPLRFVPQADLPPAVSYEAFISATGCVPTRDNLHDFFNALVWLTYPLAKTLLNALQAEEILRLSMPNAQPVAVSHTRGVLRDRATLFDENAALLITSDASIAQALGERRWLEVLVARRAAFGSTCEVRLFGHALIEKLVAPYKAITAHVWVLQVAAEYFALEETEKRGCVDGLLADALQQGMLRSPFMPLPVLGVPGWWHDQSPAFYGDVAVFRPAGRR